MRRTPFVYMRSACLTDRKSKLSVGKLQSSKESFVQRTALPIQCGRRSRTWDTKDETRNSDRGPLHLPFRLMTALNIRARFAFLHIGTDAFGLGFVLVAVVRWKIGPAQARTWRVDRSVRFQMAR